jgi:predicted nucleic acid-binding protein
MKLVVDASVAVQWFLPDERTDDAVRLFDLEGDLLAPDLLPVEVANVLWKRERLAGAPPLDIRSAVAALTGGAIRLHSSLGLLPAASDIARVLGHPIYDCLYLALAAAEDAQVVTLDRRLLGKAAAAPWSGRVVHLSDSAR